MRARKNRVCILVLFCWVFSAHFALAESGVCPVPTLTQSVHYNKYWGLRWDTSNPQVVNPKGAVEVSVLNGTPPFNWEVVESEYSLAVAQTDGRSNTLYAGSTACGAATIMVTDRFNADVTGHVRCANGIWSNTKHGCVFGGVADYIYTGSRSVGKFKDQFQYPMSFGGFRSNCDNCEQECETKASEGPQYQCEPCMWSSPNEVPCEYVWTLGYTCGVYYVSYREWICP